MTQHRAIVLGDSFNNTLGLIRSIGEAGIKVCLILVGHDRLSIAKSKYVSELFHVENLQQALPVLDNLKDSGGTLICSNDDAAKFVDDREHILSPFFRTPMRGRKLGAIFNKDAQCSMAECCGITIPKSSVYERGGAFPSLLTFPILLKPVNSCEGEKSDIHICRSAQDVEAALAANSTCTRFMVQEFIEKDYEINMIGISSDTGVFIPGGIRKIRHYPDINSPCSFGLFSSPEDLCIDTEPIERFIRKVGYFGPFSVEFLRKGDRSYFMEFNFRHDGLAYAATASGANLLDLYLNGKSTIPPIRPTYMMDLSIDFCHVKDHNISLLSWIRDFIKTGCQLNFNKKDPSPTFQYYRSKFSKG